MSNAMLRDLAIQCGHSTFLGTPCNTCGSKLRMACDRYHCVQCHRKRSREYGRINSIDRDNKTRHWVAKNAEYLKHLKESKR